MKRVAIAFAAMLLATTSLACTFRWEYNLPEKQSSVMMTASEKKTYDTLIAPIRKIRADQSLDEEEKNARTCVYARSVLGSEGRMGPPKVVGDVIKGVTRDACMDYDFRTAWAEKQAKAEAADAEWDRKVAEFAVIEATAEYALQKYCLILENMEFYQGYYDNQVEMADRFGVYNAKTVYDVGQTLLRHEQWANKWANEYLDRGGDKANLSDCSDVDDPPVLTDDRVWPSY